MTYNVTIKNENANLIAFKALQVQYETILIQYQTAKDNYTNALTIDVMNPCKIYSSTSTGISQACFNKIWSDQKCTTTAPVVNATAKYSDLLSWTFGKSTSLVASDKTLCYGSTTKPNLNTNATAVSSSHNSDFVNVSKSTWTAATGATTSATTAATNDECIQTCAANVACSGTTYNTATATTLNCSSVIGSGILTSTPSVSTNTALIPQITNFLLILQKINTQLMGIIDSIEVYLNTMQPNLDIESSYLSDLSAFQIKFKEDYTTLVADRDNIADLLEKHDNILAEYNEKSLFANRENNSLRLWTIGAIVIVIFLIKYGFGFDSPAINTIFLITVIVLIGLTLSNPTGFIGLGILFLLFLSFIIN